MTHLVEIYKYTTKSFITGGPPIKQKVAGLIDRLLGIVHIWDHLECLYRKNKATSLI